MDGNDISTPSIAYQDVFFYTQIQSISNTNHLNHSINNLNFLTKMKFLALATLASMATAVNVGITFHGARGESYTVSIPTDRTNVPIGT